MSSLTGNNQHSLKKVLRTALVGIRPADQVMLKGYLRVLLRLEADLEWVSANHTQVDLFMISEEFRHAGSVKKLLSNQTRKPVLYVSRIDSGEGRMSQDMIILPLKKLNALNSWLLQNVPALGSTTEPSSNSANIFDFEQQQNTSSSIPPAQQSVPTSNNQVKTEQFQDIIALIKQLQSHSEGLFQLFAQDEQIAIIEPRTGRLWQAENVAIPALSLQWRLQPYQGLKPDINTAQDVKQWLWSKALLHPNDLLPLISDQQQYRIRYWMKPNDNLERRGLLRIMTALEKESRNVAQLSSVAGTLPQATKKALVGLLLSGSLQPESYEALQAHLGGQASAGVSPSHTNNNIGTVANNTTSNVTNNTNSTQTINTVNDKKLSPLESVLAKRESGGQTPTQPMSMGSTGSQSNQTTQPKPPEKKGFLARLRQKLGL